MKSAVMYAILAIIFMATGCQEFNEDAETGSTLLPVSTHNALPESEQVVSTPADATGQQNQTQVPEESHYEAPPKCHWPSPIYGGIFPTNLINWSADGLLIVDLREALSGSNDFDESIVTNQSTLIPFATMGQAVTIYQNNGAWEIHAEDQADHKAILVLQTVYGLEMATMSDGTFVTVASDSNLPTLNFIYNDHVPPGLDIMAMQLGSTFGGFHSSYDSQWIAYTNSENRDDWDIYVVREDYSDQRQLTGTSGCDWWPVWSPNNQQIAFLSGWEGESNIFLVSANGEGAKQVTNLPGTNFQMSWSPNGQRIAFVSSVYDDEQRSVKQDIYLVNSDGTHLVQLTDTATEHEANPIWSPDGEYILYETYNIRDKNLWTIDLLKVDGSNRTRLITLTPWN